MNTPPELHTEHRRKGKIGRLLKKQRDLINQLLDDGNTYTEIIKQLNEQGVSLNHANLSHWHEGGYQDWLKQQIWREEIHSRHEAYSDLLAEGQSATRLPEAALQLATREICRRLHEITLTAHALDGTSDLNSFTRLVHALCRLSREVLHLQKYNDELKAAKEGGGKRFDAFRELTEAERQAILDKADDILGCRAYRGLPPLPLKPDPSEPVKSEPSAPSSPSVEPPVSTSPLPVGEGEGKSVPSVPSSPSVENQPNTSPRHSSSAGVSPAVSPTSSRPPVPQSVPAASASQADPAIPSVPSVPSSVAPPESPPGTPTPPAAKPPRRHPTPSMYGPPVQPPGPPKVPSIFDPPVRPTPSAPSAKPHPAFYPGLTPVRKQHGGEIILKTEVHRVSG